MEYKPELGALHLGMSFLRETKGLGGLEINRERVRVSDVFAGPESGE